MTPPHDAPLTHPLLDACGVEHGFGVRGAPDPPDVHRARQVHGVAVATAAECRAEVPPCADAVVTCTPGERVGVVTADCVPVLLASLDGSRVAAVHAGWRGLAAGVIGAGVAALGPARTGELRAVIGPHIAACCYEVDAPVLVPLAARFGRVLDGALRPARRGHAWLDLGRLARHALLTSGLAAHAIGAFPGTCTRCDARRFHSYRRDGSRAGRLLHHVRAAPRRGRPPAGAAG